MSSITANAAPVPYECVPVGTDEATVIITENRISSILDSVLDDEGYGTANARANNAIRKAVIANQTNGYGYEILSTISQNSIRIMRNIYLRPEKYEQIENELRVLLADIITDVQNEQDFNTALYEAHTKIYQAANPSYDPAVDKVGDFCYWNLPAVDSAYYSVAKRLLLGASSEN